MKKMFRRKIILTLVVLIAASAVFSGCGKKETVADRSKGSDKAAAVQEAAEVMEQDVNKATVEEQTSEEEPEMVLPKEEVSSGVIIRGDKAYIIGGHAVSVMDIHSGDFTTLYTDDSSEEKVSIYSNGKGVILGDNIYFYSECYDSENYTYIKKLNCIDINGQNYTEVATYTGDIYNTGDMYYRDGILYVDGNGVNDCYSIDAMGNITETLNRADMEEFAYKFDERKYVWYVHDSGKMRYSLSEFAGCKKVIISDNGEGILCDVSSGREMGLGGDVVASNDEILLTCTEQGDKHLYGTTSLKTGEYKYLFKSDDEKNFIAIDDKAVYYYEMDEEGGAVFYKCSLNNGKENEIYRHEVADSRISNIAIDYFIPVKVGNYLYLADSHDYAVYIEEINLDDGSVVCASKSFYDSGISQIGELAIRYETVEADDGYIAGSAYAAVPVLDSKFAGSKAINEILKKEGSIPFESLEDNRDEALELYEDSKDSEYFKYNCSFDLRMPNKPFFYEEKILSFYLSGYDYYGGAHGTPYRVPYVFNVNSGKQYSLAEVVNVSEEEVLELVIEGILEVASKDNMYNSEEEIREYIEANFKLDEFESFYFTEEGVAFYFEPYELAAFAAGFPETVIPFDKLGVDIHALSDEAEEDETETESAEVV